MAATGLLGELCSGHIGPRKGNLAAGGGQRFYHSLGQFRGRHASGDENTQLAYLCADGTARRADRAGATRKNTGRCPPVFLHFIFKIIVGHQVLSLVGDAVDSSFDERHIYIAGDRVDVDAVNLAHA